MAASADAEIPGTNFVRAPSEARMRSNRSGVGEFEWRAIQRGRTLSRGSSLNKLLLTQPSPVGKAVLVDLLTLSSSSHPEQNGEMFLQNSVQHNKPPWSRTFLRAGQPQKSVSVKRTGSPMGDAVLLRKHGQ